MASSVQKPGGAIHPVVGPLYAPQPPVAPLEIVREEHVVAGREFVHQEVSRQPAPLIAENAALTGLRLEGGTSNSNATDQATPASRLPIALRESDDSSGPASIPTRDQSDRAPATNEAAPISEQLEAVPAPRVYAPLIAPLLQTSSSAASPRLRQSELSQSLVPRARATEDIEIRIGRIEVTAVQPGPARVAPAKPPHRGPSLNDYLRRRDGRHHE
jgi:hypothetical protein